MPLTISYFPMRQLVSTPNALAGDYPNRSGDANAIEAPGSAYEQTGHDPSQEGQATYGDYLKVGSNT